MIKYREFVTHLKSNGCFLIRNGKNHEIWGHDIGGGAIKQSSVPRHPSIVKQTCWAICKQLGIPKFPI